MGRARKRVQTHEAITRSEQAWDQVHPDELDEMGGIATFSRARQLYYAADALAWLPRESSDRADEYARQAVEAYSDPTDPDWSFGDAAGSRADLAIARIEHGEVEGALDAISPVLSLPVEQRINGIVHSVNRVHRALNNTAISSASRVLQESIEDYTSTPVRILPR